MKVKTGKDGQHDRGHPALRSTDARTFIIIDCALADDLGQVLEDFGEVAAGLVLHRQRHDEHPHVVQIPSFGHALQRVAKLRAIGHFVDDKAELAADRIGHFGRQQIERRRDRVAGAKPADEHVERDRKLLLHLLARAGRLEIEEHQRKRGAERAGESRADQQSGRTPMPMPRRWSSPEPAGRTDAIGAIRMISINRAGRHGHLRLHQHPLELAREAVERLAAGRPVPQSSRAAAGSSSRRGSGRGRSS